MRWLVRDAFFGPGLLDAANREWPQSSTSWVSYSSLLERKQTLNDWRQFGPALRELFRRLLSLEPAPLLDLPIGCWPLVPDTLLWGAGLHEMGHGDHLDLHLDADRHPLTGLERRANAILFLHDRWQADWGGQLELWTGNLSERVARIEPVPGRLVLFETTDYSVHGVPAALTCPAGRSRRSLAVYWWALPQGVSKRLRAHFLIRNDDPYRQEKQDLAIERLKGFNFISAKQ